MLRIRIQIRWIRKILASWIRIRKNMRIHKSGSKGQNIKQKLQKTKQIYYDIQIQNNWKKEIRIRMKIKWLLRSTDSIIIITNTSWYFV